MNDNPKPETIALVGEALKIASLLDDRVGQPDKGRILAWSKQLDKYQFERDDLLDGVQAFYETPRERAIGVGDVIHHARIVRRDRLEKEQEAQERKREAESDAKAADDIRIVSATAIMGRVNKTPRLLAAEEGLQTCNGKRECAAALVEYFAAKAEAAKPNHRRAA